MHLRSLYVICGLAGASGVSGVSAGAISAPGQAINSNACAAKNTATVYITAANDASSAEVNNIQTFYSNPDHLLALTNLGKASEASASLAASLSASPSVVIVTSFVTVVPIDATPPTLTSTTTLHSIVKLIQFFIVTETLEISPTSEPITSPRTEQAAPISANVTVMGTNSTINRTLSLVKPVRTVTHYPGRQSAGGNTESVPSRASKIPATTAIPSDTSVLADNSTVDIFQTSLTKISLSEMMVKSGFMNNSGSKGATAVDIGIGKPSRNPSLRFPTVSTASLAPSSLSASSVENSGTSTADVVISPKSSVVDFSLFISHGTVHTSTGPPALSTLIYPATISLTFQYLSTRRHWNTTSRGITSGVAPTSTLAAPTPNTLQCGEQGNFTLTFDDIPPLTLSNTSAGVEPAPVFNAYHQFDFSDGFTIAPPPTSPFIPSSKPLMLEFLPSFVIGVDGSGFNTAERGFAGQISDGDHGLTGCFTFNIYGATLGCNSTGLPCDFTFTGLHYEAANDIATSVTSQRVTIAACTGLVKCRLTPVVLDHTFVDLSAVQIKAAAGGAPLGWWMDNLQLGWFNNSCNTGLCRQSTHIR